MNKIMLIVCGLMVAVYFAGCLFSGTNSDVSTNAQDHDSLQNETYTEPKKHDRMKDETGVVMPSISAGERASEKSKYADKNGDVAIIPAEFMVSAKEDEQTIHSGLVIIGPDGSEFVWIPTTQTPLAVRDFGSYVSWGANFSGYYDETDLELYQEMVESAELYGGFYIGRFEASCGGGDDLSNYVPASKRILDSSEGRIWVRFSPQDATVACQNLYADNESVIYTLEELSKPIVTVMFGGLLAKVLENAFEHNNGKIFGTSNKKTRSESDHVEDL